jgi:hypothetical protein
VHLFDQVVAEFASSSWGVATVRPESASGLCKRASLVLLGQLEARGCSDGVVLWNLNGRKDDPTATHWLLVHAGEVVDVSPRQFTPNGPHILRAPQDIEFANWSSGTPVDPDKAWGHGLTGLREIPPNWRDLLMVPPPGDLPGWPFRRVEDDVESPWSVPPPEQAT